MANTRVGLHLSLTSLSLVLLWHLIRRSKIRNPPSPRSLPFVGNLFSIPSGHEHLAFAKLGEQLESDIVFLELFGQKIIILNSAEAALEILDKHSAFHSDRPQIPMVTDPTLMNWSGLPSIVGYNDLWRHYRRMMNSYLNVRAVTQFNDLQECQARLLLKRLLGATNYTRPFAHVRNEFFFTMASTMFQLAYGYKLKDPQDPFFKEAELAAHNVLSAGMQTNFFVNIFPALSSVPDWFPGTGWKRTAREWGLQQVRAKTRPYEWVQAAVASGTYQPSLLSLLIQDHKLLSELSSNEKDERLKEVGLTMFGAGTDTSATFLVCFVAALISNPHAQAKAHQELDTILGPAVLPSISDRERLPYIRNLIDEVFRVYPALPLAIPHACFQDDTFRGYHIQKGTTIIGNVCLVRITTRAINRDPRHYKDPEVFNPDRYLSPDAPRPSVFGWGRRKCPGIHFAEASTFIMAASILAMFTFSRKRNSRGQEIIPQIELERNSFMLELRPFEFEFKPRSDEHHQLIIGAVDERGGAQDPVGKY